MTTESFNNNSLCIQAMDILLTQTKNTQSGPAISTVPSDQEQHCQKEDSIGLSLQKDDFG